MTSIHEFDAVVVDLNHVVEEYTLDYPNSSFQGKPSLSDDDSARFVADLARRRREFVDYLNAGGVVFCFTPPPIGVFVDTGERTYSGTGRNRETTRIVNERDVCSAIPSKFATHPTTGTAIRWAGAPKFEPLRGLQGLSLRYSAYFVGDAPGSVILATSKTGQPIGTVVETEARGHLVFVPHLDYEAVSDEVALDREFVDVIRAFLESRGSFAKDVMPAWANSISLPGEPEARRALAAIDEQLGALARDREAALEAQASASAPKVLLTGHGPVLQDAVANAFERLGCSVSTRSGNRADIAMDWVESRAVVEVKGLTGSAAEGHAAQLEKWVAEELEATGEVPKAILVVNGYREVPVTDRDQLVFPHQMLKYATKRGHCLVTTSQILGALVDAPAKHKEFLDLIFATEGTLQWPSFVPDAPETPDADASPAATAITEEAPSASGAKRRASKQHKAQPS